MVHVSRSPLFPLFVNAFLEKALVAIVGSMLFAAASARAGDDDIVIFKWTLKQATTQPRKATEPEPPEIEELLLVDKLAPKHFATTVTAKTSAKGEATRAIAALRRKKTDRAATFLALVDVLRVYSEIQGRGKPSNYHLELLQEVGDEVAQLVFELATSERSYGLDFMVPMITEQETRGHTLANLRAGIMKHLLNTLNASGSQAPAAGAMALSVIHLAERTQPVRGGKIVGNFAEAIRARIKRGGLKPPAPALMEAAAQALDANAVLVYTAPTPAPAPGPKTTRGENPASIAASGGRAHKVFMVKSTKGGPAMPIVGRHDLRGASVAENYPPEVREQLARLLTLAIANRPRARLLEDTQAVLGSFDEAHPLTAVGYLGLLELLLTHHPALEGAHGRLVEPVDDAILEYLESLVRADVELSYAGLAKEFPNSLKNILDGIHARLRVVLNSNTTSDRARAAATLGFRLFRNRHREHPGEPLRRTLEANLERAGERERRAIEITLTGTTPPPAPGSIPTSSPSLTETRLQSAYGFMMSVLTNAQRELEVRDEVLAMLTLAADDGALTDEGVLSRLEAFAEDETDPWVEGRERAILILFRVKGLTPLVLRHATKLLSAACEGAKAHASTLIK